MFNNKKIMSTLLSKIRFLLIAIMLVAGVVTTFADDGSVPPPISLNVKAGELSSLIPESKMYKITNLKLTGELNIDDIVFIREMGACQGCDNKGCLQHLDILDVTFVGDGSYRYDGGYYSFNVDLKTNRNIFYGSQSLQTIKLPRTLKSLGVGFLEGCNNLVSVTLPSALNDINLFAFDNCGKLTSIMIDAKNPYFHSDDSVLFNKDCTELVLAAKLTDYVIPNSVVRIRSKAFSNCSGLTSVTFPSGLTRIGSFAFAGCSGLTSVTFPSGLTTIYNNAFSGCSGLTSLTFPPGLTTIEEHAFENCSGLTSVTFPSGLTTICDDAFSGCSGLTSLIFPSGLTTIGSAFDGCSGLTSLTFPSSLTWIGRYAFFCFDDSNIKTIYSYASFPPRLGDNAFNDKVQQTSILYVPKDSYQDYWLSDTWGNFENIKTFDASAVEPVFTADDASETSRYTVGGQKQDNPVKGLNIIKMSDGSVKKIMVK